MLKTIKEVDFDIFEFEEKCSGHALVSITGYLLNKKSLFTTFMIDKFKFNIFANKIQNGYNIYFLIILAIKTTLIITKLMQLM